MSHGHPSAPILKTAWRGGQEPPSAGLPELLSPGAQPTGARPLPELLSPGAQPTGARPLPELLSPGARPPGALLPAARWVCHRTFSGQLEMGLAARAAREFTGQILQGWGLLVLADDAAVIVSELVTNAQRHGGRAVNGAAHEGIELILWRRSGQVVCAVTDPGFGAPVPVQPDPFGEAGRGLHVVQALSSTWGWTRLGGSRKAVWAAMGVPGAD
jgi:anti-sigma regulatory factor (Ser/Thr protein kinase)